MAGSEGKANGKQELRVQPPARWIKLTSIPVSRSYLPNFRCLSSIEFARKNDIGSTTIRTDDFGRFQDLRRAYASNQGLPAPANTNPGGVITGTYALARGAAEKN